MARHRSIEEILTEEDDLGLLNVTLRPRAARTPEGERDAELVRAVNWFFERTGRVPDPEAADYEELRLAILWAGLAGRGPEGDLAEEDVNRLLSGPPLTLTAEPAAPERDWRYEPDADDVPASFPHSMMMSWMFLTRSRRSGTSPGGGPAGCGPPGRVLPLPRFRSVPGHVCADASST